MVDRYHRGHYILTISATHSVTTNMIILGEQTRLRKWEMTLNACMLRRQRVLLFLDFLVQVKVLAKKIIFPLK